MKKSLLVLLILFIPFLALAQTAEDYFDKGVAKYDQGDYKGALQDYNKAIELDPKLADAYGARGIVKIALGQKDSGCLDLSKAGELGAVQVYDFIKQFCQ